MRRETIADRYYCMPRPKEGVMMDAVGDPLVLLKWIILGSTHKHRQATFIGDKYKDRVTMIVTQVFILSILA